MSGPPKPTTSRGRSPSPWEAAALAGSGRLLGVKVVCSTCCVLPSHPSAELSSCVRRATPKVSGPAGSIRFRKAVADVYLKRLREICPRKGSL